MVGSELPSPEHEESTVTDRPVLTITDLTCRSRGRDVLSGISLTIHAGEVLGIAGVEGNGQAELVEAIMGMRIRRLDESCSADTDITLAHARDPRGRRRLHPRGPAPARPAARRAAVGERILGHQTGRRTSRDLVDAAGAQGRSERIVASTTSAPPPSTSPPARCPAATSRS
jgi:simple sugar transport system ATP-binding protein